MSSSTVFLKAKVGSLVSHIFTLFCSFKSLLYMEGKNDKIIFLSSKWNYVIFLSVGKHSNPLYRYKMIAIGFSSSFHLKRELKGKKFANLQTLSWTQKYLFVKAASRCEALLVFFIIFRQILTQEDWNIVLYNGMSRTSPWAAVYFIALMTFGNYVLFNLLVAILVEGFSAEVRHAQDLLQDKTFIVL